MSVNTAAMIQDLRARRYEGPKIEVKEAVGGPLSLFLRRSLPLQMIPEEPFF